MLKLHESESMNTLEKLSKNLTSSNHELRERACSSILMKLELNLIPKNILISDYHFIVGDCLKALNLSADTKALNFVLNVLKILSFFTLEETGRAIAKQYGLIEFMAEYLLYQQKIKNEAMAEEIERFLSSLVSQTATNSLKTREFVVAEAKEPSKKPLLSSSEHMSPKFIIGNLDNKNITELSACSNRGRRLSEKDRSILVETVTQLKFSKRDDSVSYSALFHTLMGLLHDFPIDIFCSQFTELFYETVRLICNSKASQLTACFVVKLAAKLSEELKLQKQFETKPKSNQDSIDCVISDGFFITDSHPPTLANNETLNELTNEKLSIANIVEIVLRFLVLFCDNSYFFVFIVQTFCELVENLFSFSKSAHFQISLAKFMIGVVAFWEENRPKTNNTKMHIEYFEFLSPYFSFLLRLMQLMDSNDLLNNPEISSLFAKSFEFSKFSEWLVCGIIPEQNWIVLQSLVHKLSPKNADSIAHLISVNAKCCAFKHSSNSVCEKLFNTDCTEDEIREVYARAVENLPILEFSDHNLEDYVSLLLIGRSISLKAKHFAKETEQFVTEFQRKFDLFFAKVICSPGFSKNRHLMLRAIQNIHVSADKSRKCCGFDVDLKAGLVKKFEQDNWLMLLMVACLENEIGASDERDSFMQGSVTAIVSWFMSQSERIPKTVDPFLLSNFLCIQSVVSSEGKNLRDYLVVKHPIVDSISRLINIFSKDIAVASNNFNSIVFKTNPDFTISNDVSKKLSLMGFHNEQRIGPKHHLFGIVDGDTVVALNSLTALSKITTQSSFIDSNRLKDFFDIFELFCQPVLDKHIRVEALQHCIEIMISCRKNREVRGFTAVLVNTVVDRLLTEEVSCFTEGYLRLLNAFLMHQKYHQTLKLQLLRRIRLVFLQKQFAQIEQICIAFSKTENIDFKLNALTFVQLILCSTVFWETDFQESSNVDCKQTRAVPTRFEEQNEDQIDDTKMKIRFWDFNHSHFFNIFGGKVFNYSKFVKKQDFCQRAAQFLKSNDGTFYKHMCNLKAFFDAKYTGLKRTISESSSIANLCSIVAKTVCLVSLISKNEAAIRENSTDFESVLSKLDKLFQYICTQMKSASKDTRNEQTVSDSLLALSFLPVDSSSSQIITTTSQQIVEFINETSTNNTHQFQQPTVRFLVHLVQMNPEFSKLIFNNNQFKIDQFMRILSKPNLKEGLSCLEIVDSQIAITNKETFRNCCSISVRSFDSLTSFVDTKRKLAIFKTVRLLLNNSANLHVKDCFEFYLKCKEYTRSMECSIRLQSWLNLLTICKRLTDPQFLAELFFLCKDHCETTFKNENPKINVSVLSVLTQVTLTMSSSSALPDFGFLKQTLRNTNQLCLVELTALANMFATLMSQKSDFNNPQLIELSSRFCSVIFNEKVAFFRISQKDQNQKAICCDKRLDCFKVIEQASASILDNDCLEQQHSESNNIYPLVLLSISQFQPSDFCFDDSTTNSMAVHNQTSQKLHFAMHLFKLFLDVFLSLIKCTGDASLKTMDSKLLLILKFIDSQLSNTVQIENSVALSVSIVLKTIDLIDLNTISTTNLRLTVTICSNLIFKLNKQFSQKPKNLLNFSIDCLFVLKRRVVNLNCDSLVTSNGFLVAILVNNIILSDPQTQLRRTDFGNLIKLLSLSDIAKQSILESSFFDFWKNQINRMIASKDTNGLNGFCQLLKALFFPVRNKTISSTEDKNTQSKTVFQTWTTHPSVKGSLKTVFFMLCKMHLFDSQSGEELVDSQVLKVFANWHLNQQLSSFVEKQAIKGKHVVLNSVFETLKCNSRCSTPAFLQSLTFLKCLCSVELVVSQVCKTKTLLLLTNKILNLFNEDKKDQFVANSLKIVLPILDLLYAFSFNKQTHSKMFQNKQSLDALCHFYGIILSNFKLKKQEALSKSCELGLAIKLSSSVRKFLTLFANLMLSTCSKSFFDDFSNLTVSILDVLAYTQDAQDRLLISQLFYNLIYKDGSAVKVLQKERFLAEMSGLLSEVQGDLKEKQKKVLRGLSEQTAEDSPQEKTILNIQSIQEIVLF